MKERKNKQERDTQRNHDFEREYNELFQFTPYKPEPEWGKKGDTLTQFTLLDERPTFCTSDTVISQ